MKSILLIISLGLSLSTYAQIVGSFYGSTDGTESTDIKIGKKTSGSTNFTIRTYDTGGSSYLRFHSLRWGAGYTWSREHSDGVDRNIAYLFGSGSGNYFQLFKDSDQAVTLQLHSKGDSYFNGGNVGIGTSTPTSLLHLKKNAASSIGPVLYLQNNQYDNSDEAGSRIAFFGYTENRKISIDGIMRNSGKPHRLEFNFEEDGAIINAMTMKHNGAVGINTSETGSHKLAVEGSIGAREVKVEASGWSDFVFEPDYELLTLEEVEQHIQEKGHLPEIPNAAEVTQNGINLGEMNAKLLQKIEELTLYMIEMNKRMNQVEAENAELKKEVSILKNE
ncbi:hypothetical protein [Marinoscillum sp.]|uniref:hypothetical protein n=1 Tax=Marinoscillum sp. TaxID=2024838 RepID=UPI003BACC7C1